MGGENVAALNESFLSKHPAVKMPQVIGVPDNRLPGLPALISNSMRVCAQRRRLSISARGKMASFKIPRHGNFAARLANICNQDPKVCVARMVFEWN